MTDLFNKENNGANFSKCGKYRYALWRIWDETKPLVMFIGLNPSTANQTTDDPTIRRVKRFAKDWGYGGVYMMNCFPYVSTNPDDLRDFGNTATNDHWLYITYMKCRLVVFAWGNFKIVSQTGRDIELTRMFPHAQALQLNANGSPKHPLYVKADIVPVKFKQ